MFASYRNRWCIVFASMLGLLVGSGCINVFAFAIFLKPVSEGLGVGRAVLALGLLITMVLSGLGTPFVGALADRFGCRNVLLLGVPLFAATTAAFALMRPSPLLIFPFFVLAGLAAPAQNTVPYAKVVSRWFDAKRGVALAVMMAGTGLGVAIVPQLSRFFIDVGGWRAGYLGLAATIMVLGFAPVLLFVAEPRTATAAKGNARVGERLPGLTLKQAMAGWRFWAMGLAFLAAAICINGTLAHVVAMLTDRGISAARATTALSAAGIAMIGGRLVCGWCLDRCHGPSVAITSFLIPAAGILILASGARELAPDLGAILCGMGIGGVLGLIAFFSSRYFGLHAYGRIFGAQFALLLIGNGVGPYLNGLGFDALHSYAPTLDGFALALALASLLFLPLGPYPFAAAKARPPESARRYAERTLVDA